MRKKYLLFFLFFNAFCFAQNFETFASGIRVNSTIYNITGTDPIQMINPDPGSQYFNGLNLGTFSSGAGCGTISGAEVKTWTNMTGNVCDVTLHWRVYPALAAPSGAFSQINLTTVSECNTVTNIFEDGFGPCQENDQKWKNYAMNGQFTAGLASGDYMLEVWFSLNGSDISNVGCETTRFINNGGLNFTAQFSINSPQSNPQISTTSVCEGDSFTLTANPSGGSAPYTYSWTGPGGFTSNVQNPVISAAAMSNAGIYNLVVTDACGATAAMQSTASLSVTPGTIPTFDALLPAICRNSLPPILVNQSTNGITGTWSPAIVSNTATGNYVFTPTPGQCAVPFTATIFVVNNVTPNFNLPAVICYNEPAPNLPALSSNGIMGTWSPSAVNNLATTTYTFTPNAGQCATVATRTITVNTIIPTFTAIAPICEGSVAPVLPTTSVNGITGTWSPNIINNQTTTTYTFTPAAGQCATEVSMQIVVIPVVPPVFTAIDPFCQGTAAPLLPSVSTNGITGSWSPAIVDNNNSGTYTFTPIPCGTPLSIDIIVIPSVIPQFQTPDPICVGDVAPVLPLTSDNGIEGTWNPATVSNLSTGVYTFTPGTGECSVQTTLTVTVNNIVTPVFTPVGPFCSGATVPVLPPMSDNGIEGTWTPSAINNTVSGIYTFTPNPDECATPTTLNVDILPLIAPLFPAIPPICEGDAAPVLPLVSTNGITGTWNPAIVDNTQTADYTFIPDPAFCASEATVTVTVAPIVIPIFSFETDLCEGILPVPTLPLVSDNGITGSWTPAIVDTSLSGSYTFTPSPGLCASQLTVLINIEPIVIPTFDPVAPICANDPAPVLPLLSNNGITGTWSPSTVSNLLTGVYTFTPAASECALPATLTVTVAPNVVPLFDAVQPLCEGDVVPVLPLVSNNGITGTWSPSVISNTDSDTYTFTPDAGQCALEANISVVVNPIVTPAFSFDTEICVNTVAPLLPLVSDNGVAGSWNPAVVDNLATSVYTFTPSAGLCALPVTVQIDVNPIVVPTFDPVEPICANDPAPVLPTISTNGISGTWFPANVSNLANGVYTFTPNPGECGQITTLPVTVTPNVPSLFTIPAEICEGAEPPTLPTVSDNGISGSWSPAVVNNSISGTYTFTPDPGSCGLGLTIAINVNTLVTPTFFFDTEICEGEPAPFLPFVSGNGITGIWSPFIVSNTESAIYTFTPSPGLCATPVEVLVTVNPIVSPVFDPIPNICEGGVVPTLPTVSNNGISGSWVPSVIDNLSSAPYVFTPDADQCSTPLLVPVTVVPNVTPVFDAIAPICAGDAAPLLPNVSNNGIGGSWNPANVSNAETGIYVFTPNAGICAPSTSLTVTVEPVVIPSFTLPASICEGSVAPVLPSISENGVSGNWSPATVDNQSSNTYIFTPTGDICADEFSILINVLPVLTPTFNFDTTICEGSTPPALPLVSSNGVPGTWFPATISNTANAVYTFTPSPASCANETSVAITVIPNVVPVFSLPAAICAGNAAPLLPAVSDNGISGSWFPTVVSNTSQGTYTFTPDASECALPVSFTINVNAVLSPSFTLVEELCEGSAAPLLPTISGNGISGSWTPSIVSNTDSGIYVFTPDAGQCATPLTYQLTIVPLAVPTFDPISPICGGNVLVSLPAISTNGISGSWNPATINATATADYTFTPDPGICASSVTMTIAIIPPVTPLFDPIAPLCAGDTAPGLPNTSLNGVVGTWSPAIIDNNNSGDYVFTPNVGVCAWPVTVTVVVNAVQTPIFTLPSQICATIVAPLLPTTADNGITGSWTPPVVDNTTTADYLFTPDAGQCALSFTQTISVIPMITALFDSVPPICAGSDAPVLPLVSLNGVSGNWSPAVVDNQNNGTYTFTPDAGQCAIGNTLSVVVIPNTTPEFNTLPTICAGETAPLLPSVSNNGIAGSWNPPVVDNMISGTYTFTPDAGMCAPQVVLSMTVTPVVSPVFAELAPICNGGVAPLLLPLSSNGISGSWSPAVIDNTATGVYTFTPDGGQCASVINITFVVNPIVTPVFNIAANVCEGSIAPPLPVTSVNGINGIWTPSSIDTSTGGTYTFTPNTGECADPYVMTVNIVTKVIPAFDPIPALCSGTEAPLLPTISLNGISGSWGPSVIDVMNSGTYTFTPDGTQCAETLTIGVQVHQSPNDLEFDTSNVFNNAAAGIISVISVGSGTAPFTYSINDGPFEADDTFENLTPGVYIISVMDANGCIYTEEAEIKSSCRVPKGISPNDDGDNDLLVINGCNISSLEIFNRYGTKVNSFRNYANNWNGTSSDGKELPDGTYFYVADTQDGIKTGWVYLTR